jgi:hypothetical protein
MDVLEPEVSLDPLHAVALPVPAPQTGLATVEHVLRAQLTASPNTDDARFQAW